MRAHLVDVYRSPLAVDVLWRLLKERDPRENISHHQMPTWEEHVSFVASKPYQAWYLIEHNETVGACYITRNRELGVGILQGFRHLGYAEQALRMLMEKHPGKHLANINPLNTASLNLFQKLGFRLIQHTYAK